MKVKKSNLFEAVKAANAVVDRRHPNPTLRQIRLEAKDGYLRIQATDLNSVVDSKMPCEGDLLPTLVDAKELLEAVKVCARRPRGRYAVDKTLVIEVDGATLHVKGEHGERSLARGHIRQWPSATIPNEITGQSVQTRTEEMHLPEAVKEPTMQVLTRMLRNTQPPAVTVATDETSTRVNLPPMGNGLLLSVTGIH